MQFDTQEALYEKYCNQLVGSLQTLLEATRKSSQLMSAIEKIKLKEEAFGYDIPTLLEAPLKRLLKYKELLTVRKKTSVCVLT